MKNSVFNEELKAQRNRYFSADFKMKRVRELEKNLVCIADISRYQQNIIIIIRVREKEK